MFLYRVQQNWSATETEVCWAQIRGDKSLNPRVIFQFSYEPVKLEKNFFCDTM